MAFERSNIYAAAVIANKKRDVPLVSDQRRTAACVDYGAAGQRLMSESQPAVIG